jgi:hypothetical protein
MPKPSPLHQASRQILVGLGRIGARAAANAYRSVLNDVGTVAEQAKAKIDRARSNFSRFLGEDE